MQKLSFINKKTIFLIAFSFLFSFIFADSYKIKSVNYNIKGQTRKYSLETKVKVDKETVFDSEESLMIYIEDFTKRLENTRAFEKIQVDFSLEDAKKTITDEEFSENENAEENIQEGEENKLYFVTLDVSTSDSLHILAAPYPKYDSNDGFSFKLKVKDTNFFGSLEEMSSDFNFAIESDDEENYDYKFGFAIDFDIPFKLGLFDASWVNSHEFSYTIGDDTPEWNLKTGLELDLPFRKFSIQLDLYQSFIRDLDYEDADINGKTVHYGDGTYFVENAKLSVPLIIQEIPEWGNFYYTPYFEMKYNWDGDGISDLNEDLMSPVLSLGQTLSTSRINWIENFRDGLSVSITQSFSYNIQKLDFIPGISGEFQAYKALKHIAFSTDIYAFAYLNGTSSFGGRLRGIRDEQYYSRETGESDKKACESPAAIVMNFDMPIRIFVAHWDEIGFIQKIPGIRKIAKYFNMEFQLSPFVDVALSRNRATGRNFYYKDGFYAAGIEGIVYPLKWKGMTIRGSLGIDLGQKLPGLKGKLNQDWRDSKSYEISIGIGLHY